jgi:putative glutamine amidotransferase
MKPLIGITPEIDHGQQIQTRSPKERVVYLKDRYLQAVLDHGGLAVILPVTDDPAWIRECARRCDGFVLTGSAFDVPPEFYGDSPRPGLGPTKPERSVFERALLEQALRADQPVLGICGGMQLINVALGGTLYQDITRERPRSRDHQQKIKKTSTSHAVALNPASRLAAIMKAPGNRIRVNSTHHQAVRDLAPGLVACGLAPDGLIEAIESLGHRLLIGVQWHPELLYEKHPEAARLLRAFIRAARTRR